MEDDEQLYPIAILIDELKSEDVSLRLNSIQRISTIALALGPERSREELIPFLHNSLDDEDEVLMALAEELDNRFAEYIGGDRYAHLLLGPLENLATVEETVVREKACESINKVATVLNEQQVQEYYLPLLKRLTNGDWFTSRTSAASLFASVYDNVPANMRTELLSQFAALCHDDTPMVRRAIARDMSALVKQMRKETVISDILPLYRRLSTDEQDSVRLLTVQDLVCIVEKLDKAETQKLLLNSIRAAFQDKSWRVRYMAADQFVKLASAVNEKVIQEDLVPAYVTLMRDAEAEVRTAAASQTPGLAKLMDQQTILKRLMPVVKELADDPSQHVRGALAAQISALAPLLGKDATIEHLLPLFLQLLKDEFPDVRLNIISRLEQVNEVIGIDLLSQSLLPAIMELAEDKQWRVRQAIIENIPLLALQLGVQFFNEQLSSLCMSWLGDTVYSIREAATINLKKLTEVFGVEWARTTIIPKVLQMGTHPNYLYRMTRIFAVTTMTPSLDEDTILNSVLTTMLPMVQDPVPNIRFNVAKAFEVLAEKLRDSPDGQRSIQEKINPALQVLSKDRDVDVRFYATRALQATSKT
ncbi:protein phosphatase regulatory subunit Paa1 [Malassezia psittaci]|uniref:Protein phosphatase regulatory subunit Paa1 n=1 Tax=Malassezia psittaci TaxID=1821823 RepID=A0AAF0F7P5_9BASI|nr:protein phosphatase regulatory subunit Paa1 [Malassezia psittaci]